MDGGDRYLTHVVKSSRNRYLAVVHPITSMAIRNERNAFRAILLLWALISLTCLPAMLSHGLHLNDPMSESAGYVCVFLKEDWSWPAFQIRYHSFLNLYSSLLETIVSSFLT
jgi:allatostatin receptor